MAEPALEERMAHLEGRVDGFDSRFDSLERRLDTLGARLEAMDQKIDRNLHWTIGTNVVLWSTILVAVLFRS